MPTSGRIKANALVGADVSRELASPGTWILISAICYLLPVVKIGGPLGLLLYGSQKLKSKKANQKMILHALTLRHKMYGKTRS